MEFVGRVVGEEGRPVLDFSIDRERFETVDGHFSLTIAPFSRELAFEATGYVRRMLRVQGKEGLIRSSPPTWS
jgi:hypothetical protein